MIDKKPVPPSLAQFALKQLAEAGEQAAIDLAIQNVEILRAEIAERDARIAELVGVRDHLRLQASIQAQEARTQKAIVAEIGAMVGEPCDWLTASAVREALKARQPSAVVVNERAALENLAKDYERRAEGPCPGWVWAADVARDIRALLSPAISGSGVVLPDLIADLKKQAEEIAREGHAGWGNTMLLAAEALSVAGMADEWTALPDLHSAVLDAFAAYERFGTDCLLDGMPMIQAGVLEELAELAQQASAAPSNSELLELSRECAKMKGGAGMFYANYGREVLRRWGKTSTGVVLPERKPDINRSFEGSDAEWYGNSAHNACLDEVERLNRK